MRKVLALFLAATLLCVSSLPAMAEAASCAAPEMAAMHTMEGGEHAAHAAADVAHNGHDHRGAIQGDLPRDRIECGCGCHRSVDALPHLLAPHTPAVFDFDAGIEAVAAIQDYEPLVVRMPFRIIVPPPQTIS